MTEAAPRFTIRPVVRLDRRSAEAFARVLAELFDENPWFRFILPAGDKRAKGLRAIFRAIVSDGLHAGRVNVAYEGETIVGGVVWYPPSRHKLSAARQARLVHHYLRVGTLSPRALAQILEAQATAERVHPTEPHHHLFFGGVLEGRRSRGAGNLILRSALDEIDALGSATYLETQLQGNMEWYRRNGFEVLIDDLEFNPGAPRTWTMWRPPQR
jgi:ribosomal protein S18 acetylase RimI-like enzyme